MTTSDNEWQRVVLRVTTNDKDWQQMTTSGTTSDNKWQRVTTNGTTSNNEWQQMVMSDCDRQQVVKRMKKVKYTSKNGWLPNRYTNYFKGWMAAIRVVK